MNELMTQFLKEYRSIISYAIILNEDSATDYYDVSYRTRSFGIVKTGICKVSVDEFNKFKRIQTAVIWE